MELEVKVGVQGNTGVIELVGKFDESSVLPEPENFFNCDSLVINFDKLKFINSAGIAIFLRFIQRLEEKNIPFVYKNCPKGIISQVNTIVGFLPKQGRIESFYLPVFCQKCQKNFDFLMQTKDFKPEDIEIRDLTKDIQCDQMPSCKKHHSIDVIEKRYFSFLDSDK